MSRQDTRKGDRHSSPGRLIRAPGEMWEDLDRRAEAEGLTGSELVRKALRFYLSHTDDEVAARSSEGKS